MLVGYAEEEGRQISEFGGRWLYLGVPAQTGRWLQCFLLGDSWRLGLHQWHSVVAAARRRPVWVAERMGISHNSGYR